MSPAGAWSPLKRRVFRALWIATVVSSIGAWMHEVGAGWLMVTLAPNPLMVSLVQAATTLPIFFLSLPAGTLADIVDRRKYLIIVQSWMLFCAALLATLTIIGWVSPWSLLAVTFALAAGSAMMTPAWAATVPELVPIEELPPAVALNSLGVNIARAIGPAIAGALVAAAGPAAAFIANSISFVGVIVVLARWKRAPQTRVGEREKFVSAVSAGIIYARHASALKRVMARSLGFFVFATATWALLPLVARSTGGDSRTYGVLLGCIGAGAVTGAVVLPALRARVSRDVLVRGATVCYAAAMLIVGSSRTLLLLVPAMLLTGASWISVLSSLHVSAQLAVAGWVRARALAIYLIMYSIGMTTGSVLWGAVAARNGVRPALVLAAVGALIGMLATWRYSLEPSASDRKS